MIYSALISHPRFHHRWNVGCNSFLLGAWTLASELKRKADNGLLHPVTKNVVIGKKATIDEILWNGFFGFLLGFKLVYILLNHDAFFNNPQKAIYH